MKVTLILLLLGLVVSHAHHKHGPHHHRTRKKSSPRANPHVPKHRTVVNKIANVAEKEKTITTSSSSTVTTTTTSKGTTSTSTQTTSTMDVNKIVTEVVDMAEKPHASSDPRKVRHILSQPYDASRGTPTRKDLIEKRDFVRDMMRFAWKGYREKAWGYNEVKADSGRPSTNNIFGAAKTGNTIIDALDTLWIMELKDEFFEGAAWVRDNFNIKITNSRLSAFETVIRFLGGLMGAYRMSGDYMFVEKAIEVANALDPAFGQGPLPAAHVSPASGDNDAYSGRILSEVGSFHLEYYDLAHASNDQKWLDRAFGIRDVLTRTKNNDGLYTNRLSRPIQGKDGQWYSQAEGRSMSLGAEGDSFYEYLIKAYVQSGERDLEGLDMYKKSVVGAKKYLVKTVKDTTYLADYPTGSPSMQHLACFAGGMFAYGAKYNDDPTKEREDFKIGEDVTHSCYLSYHNTPTHIGGERFSISHDGTVTHGNPNYYILRPEVVESYFYLYRFTKDEKYRDWAWEAAQALEKHCKSNFGYSGLRSVAQAKPVHDDLQRSFFLAETLKYLYLIFSDDDLISLDEFVFNTEAHPLAINKQ